MIFYGLEESRSRQQTNFKVSTSLGLDNLKHSWSRNLAFIEYYWENCFFAVFLIVYLNFITNFIVLYSFWNFQSVLKFYSLGLGLDIRMSRDWDQPKFSLGLSIDNETRKNKVSVSTLRPEGKKYRSRSRHWDLMGKSIGFGLDNETKFFKNLVSVSRLQTQYRYSLEWSLDHDQWS